MCVYVCVHIYVCVRACVHACKHVCDSAWESNIPQNKEGLEARRDMDLDLNMDKVVIDATMIKETHNSMGSSQDSSPSATRSPRTDGRPRRNVRVLAQDND